MALERRSGNGRLRRNLVIAGRSGEGPFTIRFADLRYRAFADRRFVEFTIYSLASRLRASWMEARVTKVARVSARFSKSLASGLPTTDVSSVQCLLGHRRVPVIYTTPVSRADCADVVMLPTDLSAETGVPPLINVVGGTAEAGFPDEIAPRPEDYVFLAMPPPPACG
jgi:hypothetical protein